MKRIFAFILIGVIGFSCGKKQGKPLHAEEPYVIILSMDGFRWDYPEKANTPNLDYIEKTGVRAEVSIPCFPTKTFPNQLFYGYRFIPRKSWNYF